MKIFVWNLLEQQETNFSRRSNYLSYTETFKTCCLLGQNNHFSMNCLAVLLENEGWEIWSMTNAPTQTLQLNNRTKITNHLDMRSNHLNNSRRRRRFLKKTNTSKLAYNFRIHWGKSKLVISYYKLFFAEGKKIFKKIYVFKAYYLQQFSHIGRFLWKICLD